MNFDDIKVHSDLQQDLFIEHVSHIILKHVKKYLSIVRFLGKQPTEVRRFPVVYRMKGHGEVDLSYPAIYITYLKTDPHSDMFCFIGNTPVDMSYDIAIMSHVKMVANDSGYSDSCHSYEFIEKYLTLFIRTCLDMYDDLCLPTDIRYYEPIIEKE